LNFLSSILASNRRSLREKLSLKKIPVHVAIIMDGNGRWASKRNLPRSSGHKAGVASLRETIEACLDLGIRYLTVFSLSSENWKRPENEVSFLLNLFIETLKNELELLKNHGVMLRLIGNRSGIPPEVLKVYEDAEVETSANNKLNFNIALNYGSRQEIVEATKKICSDIENNKLKYDNLDEDIFSGYLFTEGIPDPDLLIRTSGEYRLSNFLLWQISYTELYFSRVLWPDFKRKYFIRAIKEYQKRHRRFGKV
jgi:undecaprenyl diphosphate synthase